MKVRGVGMTLHGAEGQASPPLPFVEVEDGEGAALIALYPKNVIAVGVEAPVAETSQEEADRLAAEWAASEEAARIAAQEELAANPLPADEPEPAPVVEPVPEPVVEPEPEIPAGDADLVDPLAEVLDAIDLLEADGFVKTGARKGKPKVEAVAAILDRDVTIAEIDAALAAKNEAE